MRDAVTRRYVHRARRQAGARANRRRDDPRRRAAGSRPIATSGTGVDVIQPRPAPTRRTRSAPGCVRARRIHAAWRHADDPGSRGAQGRRGRGELAHTRQRVQAARQWRKTAQVLHVIYAEAATRGDATDRRRSVRGLHASGRKVIAVGDARQLSSVNAGGWFPAIRREIGGVELNQVASPARPERDPRARRAARRPPPILK